MNESEKGICRLSLVAMRDNPSYDAIMVSQVLFGEHYTIVEKKGTWLKIKLHCDDSEGWICHDHHDEISEEYFEQINLSDYKVCTDVTGNIFFKKRHVNILLGSVLPISTHELFKLEEQVAFNGSSKSLNQKRDAEFLKEIVATYMHTPYLPGGKSPFGIDDGGFIQQVFKICGYSLKRSVGEQVKQGQEVQTMEEIAFGDIVYLGKSKPTRAFIYLPDGKYAGMHEGKIQKLPSIDDLEPAVAIRRVLYPS